MTTPLGALTFQTKLALAMLIPSLTVTTTLYGPARSANP